MFRSLVSWQSWRSGWSRTSCTLRCVTSSLATASASRWFMCPTSPTSPIRTPPTRDSCKTFLTSLGTAPALFARLQLFNVCFFFFFLGTRIRASSASWRSWRGVLFVSDFHFVPSSSCHSKELRELSCWSRWVSGAS